MRNVEVENGVPDTVASRGAGAGSRAADSGARGRQGARNASRGSLSSLRGRLARAAGSNRGRGSRARRADLNRLSQAAQGNRRGNLSRRAVGALRREATRIEREIRRITGAV